MTEQNLSSLISRAVAAKMTPEFIEKEVDSRVSKLVIESINEALRSYSDIGKQIRDAVTKALVMERIDIPTYGAMVTDMVKRQIEASVAPIVSGRLAQDIEELLKLAPKEIKLSQIAEEMIENYKMFNDHAYGDCITVHVEENDSGSSFIYLDEQAHYSSRDKYRCKFSVLVREDGTISCVSSGDHSSTFKNESWIGRSFGLDQRLRAYIACDTRIILDTDYVVIGVGDY